MKKTLHIDERLVRRGAYERLRALRGSEPRARDETDALLEARAEAVDAAGEPPWWTRPLARPVLRLAFARQWAAAVALAAAAMLHPVSARAQAPAPVRTVPLVDLDRYAGDWFEIARFPNRFQRQCVGDVRASYARRADGRFDVVNRCRTADGQTEARGVGRIVDERTFARLKVRFAPAWLSWLPVVWGDYWIIGLAADYSWAVVGSPNRDYLWVLARAPYLDDEAAAAARAAARASGFDVERLVPTPQAAIPRTTLSPLTRIVKKAETSVVSQCD